MRSSQVRSSQSRPVVPLILILPSFQTSTILILTLTPSQRPRSLFPEPRPPTQRLHLHSIHLPLFLRHNARNGFDPLRDSQICRCAQPVRFGLYRIQRRFDYIVKSISGEQRACIRPLYYPFKLFVSVRTGIKSTNLLLLLAHLTL